MATPEGRTRTNYFAVTDKEAFERLVDALSTGGDDEARMIENSRGEVGFICNDIIFGIKPKKPERNVDDYDAMEQEMVKQIQALLVPGHACILTEVSWEKLITVNGVALVITKDNVNVLDMRECALKMAQKMLDNPKYYPNMEG